MDIGYDKPDVRFYEEALRRCKLEPQDVLMVGDSMTTDILGAQAAGISSVFFDRRGEGMKESEKRNVALIAELPQLVALL